MAAIIANTGLGLFNATRNGLGDNLFANQGPFGQSQVGLNFNIATGNVVVWDGDAKQVGQGVDARFGRTYNSQGGMGVNAWRFSFEKQLSVQGAWNTSGSKITLVHADEHVTTYEYQTSGEYAGKYLSKEGDGAHDYFTYSGGKLVLTEGSSQVREIYENRSGSEWYLKARVDQSGQGIRLSYNSSHQVVEVATGVTYDSSHNQVGTYYEGYTKIGYDSSNRVNKLEHFNRNSRAGDVGHQYTTTEYTYNAEGRLHKVRTDLSNKDHSFGSDVFETTYTYDGVGRVASISQSDGTFTELKYDGSGRIQFYKVGSNASTESEQLSYEFQYGSTTTHVIDKNNNTWTYTFDGQKRVTQVQSPSVNGLRKTAEYAYDGTDNNITRTVDGDGRDTRYAYDARGNLIDQISETGERVVRYYNTDNQIISETQFTNKNFTFSQLGNLATAGVEQNVNSSNSSQLTTHYVYRQDGSNRLRFVISPEKRVTEYRYSDSQAEDERQIDTEVHYEAIYTGAGTPTESALSTWANNLSDKSKRSITQYDYDFNGQLERTKQYAATDSSGNGVANDAMTETVYEKDIFGNLLSEIKLMGTNRTIESKTSYLFDGLNRLTSTTNAGGQVTSIKYTGNQIETTAISGATTTKTYNTKGILVSTQVAASDVANDRDTKLYYDNTGRLIARKDAAGGMSYRLYDDRNRLQYTIDATGAVIKSIYDNSNKLTQTKHYAKRIDTTSLYGSLNHTTHQGSIRRKKQVKVYLRPSILRH